MVEVELKRVFYRFRPYGFRLRVWDVEFAI